ncbi:hypothetical protein G7Y41_07075 [Schaalia sp. ZJ405]|uniref:Gp19/Gp15/Gp42 family protein n=1 Tax=Schaalia sp. ZJ405 TaxID=2709403 RepID=UPI0013EBD0C6|nr:Gp19/Gp15/Gp42 family protein [Schaalia sp. ZJ405]QPK80815.1 hypothetical protein G7Y41_07075 [Schaalia sp. ZJ405]
MSEENPPETLVAPKEYEAAYGEGSADTNTLTALLAKATRIVRDELAADGYDLWDLLNKGKIRTDTAKDVVIDMVAYALRSSNGAFDAPFGAAQASMTGGPYSQSATFTAPVGSLSFTKVHRRRLGLPRLSRAFEVDLLTDREDQS